jgi:hypothetical protein
LWRRRRQRKRRGMRWNRRGGRGKKMGNKNGGTFWALSHYI